MDAPDWAALAFVMAALVVTALGGMLRTEEAPPVPADDPTRDPAWCWTHGMKYPACAPQHEQERK